MSDILCLYKMIVCSYLNISFDDNIFKKNKIKFLLQFISINLYCIIRKCLLKTYLPHIYHHAYNENIDEVTNTSM